MYVHVYVPMHVHLHINMWKTWLFQYSAFIHYTQDCTTDGSTWCTDLTTSRYGKVAATNQEVTQNYLLHKAHHHLLVSLHLRLHLHHLLQAVLHPLHQSWTECSHVRILDAEPKNYSARFHTRGYNSEQIESKHNSIRYIHKTSPSLIRDALPPPSTVDTLPWITIAAMERQGNESPSFTPYYTYHQPV